MGSSNFAGWDIGTACQEASKRRLAGLSSEESIYHLNNRTVELEVIPACRYYGLGLIPWSPLRGGWLSGKFRRGMTEPPKGSRIEVATEKGWGEAWQHYNIESTWRVMDALQVVATE